MTKRLFDFLVSFAGILILLPLYFVLGLSVYGRLGKPILYRQMRAGRNGKPFVLYKFRTMADQYDEEGNVLPDEQRLGSFGRILRNFSFDELPELWNVLRGDMSLVGPRPLLMRYLPRYNAEQRRRHEVRPGVTGWAQIHGRNALSWEERFKHDVWYVDNRSFWLDIRILAITFVKILRKEGVSAEGHATMPEFTGNHT
jgi:sugar transferase EpsL